MQALLKTEPEEVDDEIVDIITMTPACQKLKVKEEEQETDMEPKFYLGPCVSAQFVSETAQQVKRLSSDPARHSDFICEILLIHLANLQQAGFSVLILHGFHSKSISFFNNSKKRRKLHERLNCDEIKKQLL